MAFSRTWWLVLLVLALGAGSGRAAGGREQRAYDEAVLAFHNGLWDLADLEFAQFAQKYPASPRLPAAGLFQAQAEFKLGKYAQCELLLTTRRAAAGHELRPSSSEPRRRAPNCRMNYKWNGRRCGRSRRR